MLRFIEDITQWNELMELSKTKLVVVDFTASWYVSKSVHGAFRSGRRLAFSGCMYGSPTVDSRSPSSPLMQLMPVLGSGRCGGFA